MTTPRRSGIGRAVIRRLPLVGTMLGVALALWLIATNDLAAIGAAFGRIGALGLAGIVLMRVISLSLCGLAWARVLDGLSRAETAAFVILRFVREGINVLLPVASIGGEVVGGRLLTFWGVAGTLAAASILVDMLLQVSSQVVFTLMGVGLLRQVEGQAAASLGRWALNAIGIAIALLAAFFAFQRFGTAHVVERGLASLSRQVQTGVQANGAKQDGALGVQAALDIVWGRDRRGRLIQSFALHLAAWGVGTLEIWIVLTCIGVPFGLATIVMLESLSQAIKAAAFPVPSGLGVQEGGFVVIGALFGIDAGTAIALSLAKRVPDVALGLPSLIAWQRLEARRGTVLPPSS